MDRALLVLVAEPRPDFALCIEHAVGSESPRFAPLRAVSWPELAGKLEQDSPALVFLNPRLPGIAGPECAGQIKSLAPSATLILLANEPDPQHVVSWVKAGVDELLPDGDIRRLSAKTTELLSRWKPAPPQRAESLHDFPAGSPVLMWKAPAQKGAHSFSDAWRPFTGVGGWNAARKDWMDLIHPNDQALCRSTYERSFDAREHFRREYRLRRFDGQYRWVLDTATPRVSPTGEFLGYIGACIDITDLKRTEQALRESEERYRILAETSNDAIIIVDEQGRVLYANQAVERTFGCASGEIPGASIESLAPGLLECVRERASAEEDWGQTEPREFSASRRDDRRITLEASVCKFFKNSARLFAIFLRDITARKTAEQERSNLEELVRHAQKMESVGRLAAGVAHDFNNLLTVIRGHAGMLQALPALPPPAAESLRQITQAAGAATNLTRQLLTFSRKQVLEQKVIHLNSVIVEVLRMLKRMIGEDIALNFVSAPNLPPILADSGMIEQVLMNLAVNARDAMPKGGCVTIRTHLTHIEPARAESNPEARPGWHNQLIFSDDGCGMDAATLSRIFEPFFTTKEKGKGTGLGLATVYGIVKQHRGWIEVESAAGAGATFRIFLPVCDGSVPGADAPRPGVAANGDETVLVVEDDRAVLDLTRRALLNRGYSVLTASSGPEALAVWGASRNDVDLLLTDMVLPNGLTGLELADRLQAQRPALRVLFTSGYAAEMPDSTRASEHSFLPKPFTTTRLAEAVRECLDAALTHSAV